MSSGQERVDLYARCEKEEERQNFACDLTLGLSFRAFGVLKNQEVRGGESSRGMLMFCHRTPWV